MRTYLLLLAAALVLPSCAHQPAAPESRAVPDVAITQVAVRDFSQTISATGRVGGVNGSQTKVSFVVPGVIRDIDVRIGDRVSGGQALATLDGRSYDLAATQAQDEVSAAAANAHQAAVDRFSTRIAVDESALRRAQSLYSAGVAPHKDVDAAQAQLAQDRADATAARDQIASSNAQLQSSQTRASMAQRDVQNTVLRAPVDGIVSAIYHRPGESVTQTDPVMSISAAAENEITLSVSGNDAAGVHAGDPVTFSIVGSQLRSSGRVWGVASTIDPATQMATVTARGLPGSAPIGSVVQATIIVGTHRGIVVPQSALVQDPQTGSAVAFVATRQPDGTLKFQQRIVHIEMRDADNVLVSSGLRPGERIASQGGFALLAPAGSGGD